MDKYRSLYNVLGVPPAATPDEIKAAFRRRALECHPDRNGGSPESQAEFILLRNAYETLSDPLKKAGYDSWLAGSEIFRSFREASPKRSASLPSAAPVRVHPSETLVNQVNYLLWDVEDLLRDLHNPAWTDISGPASPSAGILRLLAELDFRVLTPAGFPDHFFSSRGIVPKGPEDFLSGLVGKGRPGEHRPYVHLHDYFYALRKRAGRFLSSLRPADPFSPLPGSGVPLADAVFFVLNGAFPLLAEVKRMLASSREGRANRPPHAVTEDPERRPEKR